MTATAMLIAELSQRRDTFIRSVEAPKSVGIRSLVPEGERTVRLLACLYAPRVDRRKMLFASEGPHSANAIGINPAKKQ